MSKKIIACIAGGFVGMAAGFVGGGILGMNIFGNYFVHVTFLGYRGYEAGFYIIGIPGGILGIAFGVFLAQMVSGGSEKKI